LQLQYFGRYNNNASESVAQFGEGGVFVQPRPWVTGFTGLRYTRLTNGNPAAEEIMGVQQVELRHRLVPERWRPRPLMDTPLSGEAPPLEDSLTEMPAEASSLEPPSLEPPSLKPPSLKPYEAILGKTLGSVTLRHRLRLEEIHRPELEGWVLRNRVRSVVGVPLGRRRLTATGEEKPRVTLEYTAEFFTVLRGEAWQPEGVFRILHGPQLTRPITPWLSARLGYLMFWSQWRGSNNPDTLSHVILADLTLRPPPIATWGWVNRRKQGATPPATTSASSPATPLESDSLPPPMRL
jgi:hypothetical protein